MRAIVRFVMFWYDFVVGDDASVAVGVVVALALTAWLAHAHVAAWWVVPIAAGLLLVVTLARAARRARR